ncbi:MAG: DMT family transporter [Hyphomicrobiales bacterium]
MPWSKYLAYATLPLAPLFFASNMLFGKAIITGIEPWTLAFVRWGLVFIILLPFVIAPLWKHKRRVASLFSTLGVMGFLGMWICGAIVYFALTKTSGTNAILIYLSSPVLIVLFEAIYRGRRILLREGVGILIASIGVLVILMRGNVDNALALNFNVGDVAMVFAAIAWAVYSVMFKSESLAGLPSAMLLCVFSFMGAVTLAPFAAMELAYIAPLPTDKGVWLGLAGIVFSSSIAAFLAYQNSVRMAGPAIAGIFMYLLPVYGVGLAVLILGESFEQFHMIGILTIMSGVILATFPVDLLKRKAGKQERLA